MTKRILFVDDEENVLSGLRRMLRSMREEWETAFVSSGKEALAKMIEEPFDIVISDMRMPGMDGAELLTEIKNLYPYTIRIILSGQASEAAVLQALGPTHQYLAKPCDPDKLKNTIERAYQLRSIIEKENLRLLVSKVGNLPSIPSLYTAVMKEAESEHASIQKMGELIAQDIGMSAKMLQLVNSAFFGLSRHVSSISEAINLLGLDRVKNLILTANIFSKYDENQIKGFSFEQLWQHSLTVASFAKIIAESVSEEDRALDLFYLAALLHDTGKLVLSSQLPELYNQVLEKQSNEGLPLWQAEQQLFGASHAELGAYLLGLWGLPDILVEALAFHHQPSHSLDQGFNPLTVVHVANAIAHGLEANSADSSLLDIDETYMKKLGMKDQIDSWFNMCKQSLEATQAEV